MNNKNILFVSTQYPSVKRSQYCVFLEQKAVALTKIGYNVEVLVPVNIKTVNFAEINSVFFHGIKVHYMPIKITKKNRYLKIPVNIKDFPSFPWQNYQIIHLHICSIELFCSFLKLSKKYNIKIIKHVHGLNVWKDYYQKYKYLLAPYYSYIGWLNKCLLSKVDTIIGVSNLVCNIVREKIKQVPVYTVYNGADINLFHPKKNYRDNSTQVFNILCVGNLIPIKGQRYLMEAVANLIYKGKDIHLDLIGTGSDLYKLKELCFNLKITENVSFLGERPYEQVVKQMVQADAFILPSFFDACACVYFEAMATGLPTCACINNNGISEIIKHKDNGLLVRGQNVKDIENIILFLIDNPDEAKSIGLKGYETVKNFTWEKAAQKISDIYKNLLKF